MEASYVNVVAAVQCTHPVCMAIVVALAVNIWFTSRLDALGCVMSAANSYYIYLLYHSYSINSKRLGGRGRGRWG